MVRHEASTLVPAGQRPDTEGDGVPEAPGGKKVASADPEVEAAKVTGGPENPWNPPDSAADTGLSGPEATQGHLGGPEEAAAVPLTGPRKIWLSRLLGRLRRSIFRERPKASPESAWPANVRPWTGEILPHVSETREGGPLARLMDLIAWHTTLPEDRYMLHAERRRRRRESLVKWELVRFAATFVGRPTGPPPWLVKDQQDDEK